MFGKCKKKKSIEEKWIAQIELKAHKHIESERGTRDRESNRQRKCIEIKTRQGKKTLTARELCSD